MCGRTVWAVVTKFCMVVHLGEGEGMFFLLRLTTLPRASFWDPLLMLFDLEQWKDHNTSRVGKFFSSHLCPKHETAGVGANRVHPTYFHTRWHGFAWWPDFVRWPNLGCKFYWGVHHAPNYRGWTQHLHLLWRCCSSLLFLHGILGHWMGECRMLNTNNNN